MIIGNYNKNRYGMSYNNKKTDMSQTHKAKHNNEISDSLHLSSNKAGHVRFSGFQYRDPESFPGDFFINLHNSEMIKSGGILDKKFAYILLKKIEPFILDEDKFTSQKSIEAAGRMATCLDKDTVQKTLEKIQPYILDKDGLKSARAIEAAGRMALFLDKDTVKETLEKIQPFISGKNVDKSKIAIEAAGRMAPFLDKDTVQKTLETIQPFILDEDVFISEKAIEAAGKMATFLEKDAVQKTLEKIQPYILDKDGLKSASAIEAVGRMVTCLDDKKILKETLEKIQPFILDEDIYIREKVIEAAGRMATCLDKDTVQKTLEKIQPFILDGNILKSARAIEAAGRIATCLDKDTVQKTLETISKKFGTGYINEISAIKAGIELATLLDDKETLSNIYDKVKPKADDTKSMGSIIDKEKLEAMTSIALALGGKERFEEVRACIKDHLDKTKDLDKYIFALNQKYRLDKRQQLTNLLLGPQQEIEKITLEGKDYKLNEAGKIDQSKLSAEEKEKLNEYFKIAPLFNLPIDIRANIARKMGTSEKDIKYAEKRNKEIIQDEQNSSSQKASSSGLSVSA